MTFSRGRLRGSLAGSCLVALVAAGPLTPAAAQPSSTATPSPTGTPSVALSPAASASPTPTPVANASTSYSLRPEEFALTVSPARLALDPDELEQTQQITVVNRGEGSLDLVVQRRNFTANPDGSLTYTEDAPYGAAAWVTTTPDHFTLPPGATQIVTADIAVPTDPEPGDHDVAIVVLMPATGNTGNVRVNRGIGLPLYLTVKGPVDDTVRLAGVAGPRFVLTGHADLTATLQNTGTVHRDFRGPTALPVGTRGHETHFADFTVPRGAGRVVTTTWTPPLVCICHPSATFRNGDDLQQASTRVIVFPWWLAAALLLAVLAAILVPLRVRRHRRRLAARATPARAAEDEPGRAAGAAPGGGDG